MIEPVTHDIELNGVEISMELNVTFDYHPRESGTFFKQPIPAEAEILNIEILEATDENGDQFVICKEMLKLIRQDELIKNYLKFKTESGLSL